MQEIIDGGAHHLTDAEGANGTEARSADDAMIDDAIGAGLLNSEDFE